ncbi:biotin/lipoyl-binding protein [bacterium]|nr:biotin/lipoyl-binding protein [bacterium]
MSRALMLLVAIVTVGAGLSWVVVAGQNQRAAIELAARQRDDQAGLEDWQKQGQFVVAQGTIDVAEGTTKLTTSIAGRVESVLVKDGDAVKKGQVLLELDSRSAKIAIEKAEALVRESEIQLREAEQFVTIHGLQVRQQQQKLAAARASLEMEQTQLQKIDSVGNAGGAAESTRSMQQQKVIAQTATMEVETLQLEQLEKIRPQDKIDQANAALAISRADLERAQNALEDFFLKAPSDGTILQVRTRPGEIVGPGSADLLWFVGSGPRIIRCEVNHRFSRLVGDGMPVLYYQDDTGEFLGKGRVERRSAWIADQREESARPFQRADQRTLECLVAIDSHPDRLWIGERVRVVIRTNGNGEPTDTPPNSRVSQALR